MLRDPLFAEILDSAFHAPGRSLELVTAPAAHGFREIWALRIPVIGVQGLCGDRLVLKGVRFQELGFWIWGCLGYLTF